MPSCVVCGRSRNSKSKSDDITFHRLPAGPLQAEWIKFAIGCGIHASMLKPLISLFCSEHFNKNCFEKYVRTTLLKPDSVPSIMVQRLKCVLSSENPINNCDPITTSPDVQLTPLRNLCFFTIIFFVVQRCLIWS
ncbi:hypothetical protein ACI65C_013342 [Semiaphis heraclei]